MLNSVLWSKNIVNKTLIFKSLVRSFILYVGHKVAINQVNDRLQRWIFGEGQQGNQERRKLGT